MLDAMVILKTEISKSNITKTAEKLGYARTSLSLYLNGKYKGDVKTIEGKIIETFANNVDCPLFGEITFVRCEENQNSPMPTSSPQSYKNWRICRSCRNRTI